MAISPEIQALRDEIQKRTGKTPEQRYEEKETRIRKTINLEKADRVPIIAMVEPSDYTDVPRSAAYYDPVAFRKANIELAIALDTDTGMAGLPSSGYAMELLDVHGRPPAPTRRPPTTSREHPVEARFTRIPHTGPRFKNDSTDEIVPDDRG